MRKFFALALAVAMVLSLASVSFAADPTTVVELTGPYRYKSDENDMIACDGVTDSIRYGSAAYYMIAIDDTAEGGEDGFQSTYKKIEKLKVKAEFEMGEDLVDSISIVKKYVDNLDTDANVGVTDADAGYFYFVEMKIANKETTSAADIVAELEFNRKKDSDINNVQIKDEKEEVEFSVFYGDTYITKAAALKFDGKADDAAFLKYDTTYAVKFDCDEEIEFEFGDGDHNGTNEGTFTVDVSGQGKLLIKYDTKANEAIANANPGVTMHFVNFNNVKFNRVGEFMYSMDDMVAAYKVVGDQLVEIKGAEFDTDEVVFNTRTLESYVFATAELVNPTVAVEAPVVEAPAAVTNPSTGA